MSNARSLRTRIPAGAGALVACLLVLGACGGASRPGDETGPRSGLGTPQTATNEGDGGVVPRPGEQEPGVVEGQPEPGDLAPPDEEALSDGEGSCGATDAEPSRSTLRVTAQDILCLLNAERAARGLRALRSNRRLARAARRHSADMVHNVYFSHDAKNGASMLDRIKSSGYLKARAAFTVGENIGWGSGTLATPSALVRAWMDSPPHRANILRGSYREIGIGLVLGAPISGVDATAVTATTNFGRVRR